MDKQGFIDFNTRLSPENSGKTDSYARAIRILDALAHTSRLTTITKSQLSITYENIKARVVSLLNKA